MTEDSPTPPGEGPEAARRLEAALVALFGRLGREVSVEGSETGGFRFLREIVNTAVSAEAEVVYGEMELVMTLALAEGKGEAGILELTMTVLPDSLERAIERLGKKLPPLITAGFPGEGQEFDEALKAVVDAAKDRIGEVYQELGPENHPVDDIVDDAGNPDPGLN